ncbi:hypothetical protein ACNQFZ_14910 [Schinkia sp. CFF1]
MLKNIVFLLICNVLTFEIHIPLSSMEERKVLNPKVIDIETSPVPIINQWVTLRQRSTGELLIKVDAINTREVKFWTVPVKNKSWQDSWDKKKLLSIDQDGSDGWSTIFFYGQENLLTFIVVEAIGHNGQTDKKPFYVVYRK